MTDNEKEISNINGRTEENVSVADDMSDKTDKPGKPEKAEKSEKSEKKPKKISEKEKLREEILSLTKKNEELYNMHLRTLAEYENFRRRTTKEKSAMFDDGIFEAAAKILPIADNSERALSVSGGGVEDYKKGVEMIINQIKEVFTSLEIEEINPMGESFNPELHNAVMHIEDENYKENEVVEVLQKGYKKGDKILRFAMVKVAN